MSAKSEVEFLRFREDPEQYENSKREWSRVFDEAVSITGTAEWSNWLREPFVDGSPILSRINRAAKHGIVINQILPEEDELSFRAYLDGFADGSDQHVEMLVITCTLTQTSKNKAARLIREYYQAGVSSREMELLCEQATG
jgi:hypothetical protein